MQGQDRRLEVRLMFVSAAAIFTLIAVCAMAVGFVAAKRGSSAGTGAAPQEVSASSTLKATLGRVVYSDNFHDASTGWPTTAEATGRATYSYTVTGYQIVGTGLLLHPAQSPYQTVFQQMSISMTAQQSADSPSDAGFGVVCRRGSGGLFKYELYVEGAKWIVLRRDGRADPTNQPYVLKEGTSPSAAGPVPITLVGVCATLADGVSTRLVLFVNGSSVVDLVDVSDPLPGDGWLSGMLAASSDKGRSTVTVTVFQERDLTG
jgi:hypothetical protein